jgi:hypothetical protein
MPQPNIAALSRALLRCEGAALLDARLDQLADHVEHEPVRAVFTAFLETGAATTLREALQDERLADWLDEHCATRELLTVAYQLRVWLGLTAPDTIGLDDVARLADVEPLPFETKRLSRWAERHGLRGELIRPAIEVLLDPRECREGVSVLDAAINRDGEVRAHVQRAVRTRLQHAAAAALGPSARERLWSRSPPSAAMLALSARLRPLLAAHSLALLCQVRFVPTRPVVVDPANGRCRGVLLGKSFATARLELRGYEQCALEASCSECRDPGCVHVAALAARLLDACLDTADRLHIALAAFTRTPSWRRFLDEVSSAPSAPQEHADLISFVVAREGARVAIGARSVGRAPKLAAPLRLLRSKRLEERDRGLLQSMARLARTRGGELVAADIELLRALIDHPRVTWRDGDHPVHIGERRLQLRLESHAQGVVPQLTLLGRRVDAKADDAYALMESADRRSLVFAAPSSPNA